MLKIVCIVWCLAAFTGLGIKLFTYSYYLADDATVGIALRSQPGLVSHQPLQESDYVLLGDEMNFLGEECYLHLTSWGWIFLLAGLPFLRVFFI